MNIADIAKIIGITVLSVFLMPLLLVAAILQTHAHLLQRGLLHVHTTNKGAK